MRIVPIFLFLFSFYSSKAELFIQVLDAPCHNEKGSAKVDSVGGIATPLYYTVSPGNYFSRTGSFQLDAGSYVMSAFDQAGNKLSQAFYIKEADVALSVDSVLVTHITCPNVTGSAIVLASGGTPPYSYFYAGTGSSPTQDSANFLSILGGGYYFYVIDSNNCSASSTIEYIRFQTVAKSDSVKIVPASSCDGDSSGSLQLFASYGILSSTGNYTYSSGSAPIRYHLKRNSTNSYTTNTTGIFTDLPRGTYSWAIEDTLGCANPYLNFTNAYVGGNEPVYASAHIEYAPSSIQVYTLGSGQSLISCTKETRINMLGGVPPYDVLLLNQHQQIIYQGNNINSFTLQPSPSEQYKLIIQDSIGCMSDTLLFSYPNNPLVQYIDSLSYPCLSVNTNLLYTSGSGGVLPYTFQLNENNISLSGSFQPVRCSENTVRVTDAVGCAIDTLIDYGCGYLNIEPISVSSSNCAQGGTILMDTSNADITYLLENSQSQSLTGNGFFTSLSYGQYKITATDANTFCSKSTKVYIQRRLPDVELISRSPNCKGSFDGSIVPRITVYDTLDYVDSLTYRKMDEVSNMFGSQISFVDSLTAIGAGLYYIQVYFSRGCTMDRTVRLEDGPSPSTYDLFVVDENCHTGDKGIVSIRAGNSYYYDYSLDSISWNKTSYFTELNAGRVEVYVRELIYRDLTPYSCITKVDTTIELFQNLTLDSIYIEPVSCFYKNDASLELHRNDLTYSLVPVAGKQLGTTKYVNMPAGFYILSGEKKNGCRVDTSITIEGVRAIEFNTFDIRNTNVHCYGGLGVRAVGGIGAFTYALASRGGLTNSTGEFENLCTGSYTVIATDENACQLQRTFKIIEDLDAPKNMFTETKVYPNPSSGIVSIRLPYTFQYEFELYNCQGKMLVHQKKENKVEQIDLSSLTKGLYFIKLKTQIDRKEFKLVIE